MVISYDVSTSTDEGRRRLRKISKLCLQHGQRVQNSVFECLVDPVERVLLIDELLSLIDEEQDALRIYDLGKNWKRRVLKYGLKQGYDPESALMI